MKANDGQLAGQGVLRTVAVVLVVLSVAFIQLRGFTFAGAGLDPSWMLALEHGARQGLTWGKDIIFTFGPLGYLSPALFHPETAPAILAWQLMLLAGWLVFLSACRPLPAALLLLVSLPVLMIGVDHLALVLPVGGAVLAVLGHPRRAIVLFVLAGVAANVKFSSFVAGFMLAGISDLLVARELLRLKRVPSTAAVAVGVIAGFLAAGQPFSALWGHLATSLQMAAGYSDAMVQYGPAVDLLVYAVACLLTGAAVLITPGVRHRAALAVVWLSVSFLLFKLGYVRHSGMRHSFTLATVAASGLFLFAATATRLHPKSLLVQSAVLLALTGVATVYLPNSQTPADAFNQSKARLSNRWKTIRALPTASYWDALRARRVATEQQVSSLWQVPEGSSVDAIGWDAAVAMMSGGDYRPRPVFQSYAAYTPELAARNLEHYQLNPPDRLHFRSTGIDWRWPGLGDGNLHPFIQQNYSQSKRLADALELSFNNEQRCTDTSSEPVQGLLDQWLDVTDGPGVQYLKLEINRTWLHALRKTLFKSSLLMLEARFADGSVVERRFPSGFSGLWFPVSPFLDYGNELMLFNPDVAPASTKVRQIRLREGQGGPSGVAPELRWTLRNIQCQSAQDNWISQLTSNAVFDHPHGPKFEQGAVSAHAPMLFELPVKSLTSVTMAFGIRNGAWQQGQTDGVRFDIVSRDRQGRERLLATRTLKPLTVAADRGEQTLEVNFAEPYNGILMIGILPLDNTGWDWSYIRDLQLDSTQ